MYCAQVKWEGWMDSQKEFTVDSRLRFSDIIVPTMDTVRSNFMVELLATNSKPVRIHHYHVVFTLIYTPLPCCLYSYIHITTMWFLHYCYTPLPCYLSTNGTMWFLHYRYTPLPCYLSTNIYLPLPCYISTNVTHHYHVTHVSSY